jgi:small subunit ribosomal protein S16
MAVTIRLSRAGTKKNAYFHVVASDSRKPRDGRFIERIGRYDPKPKPSIFKVDRERLNYWLEKGATTSDTVAQLLVRFDRTKEES